MTSFSFQAAAGTPVPHVGIISVVGRTNAGKSTLVNKLLGEKVSIVSPVVQTTRSVIRGVLTEERGQIVFLDTPGLHQSRSLLSTEMNKQARASLKGADAVLLLCDASKNPLLEDKGWMQRVVRSEIPVIIFLNKADLTCKGKKFHDLWDEAVAEAEQADKEARERAEKAAEKSAEVPEKRVPVWKRKKGGYTPPAPVVTPIWMIGSAQSGAGAADLLDQLFSLLPSGELLFDADTLTDYPQKLAVADVIREKFFLRLDDELPHAIGVKTESVSQQEDGSYAVKATVYVRQSNQKGIVLGEKGRNLRAVIRASERALQEFFGAPARVDLWVKVEKNWDENYFLLRQIGYC